MREYTIIGNFNYKNNKYELLLDEEQRYYFLKINEKDNYEYITLKEFVELGNLFSHQEYGMNIEKKVEKKNKLKLVPKILIGSLVVPLTLSLGMSLNHMKNIEKYDYSHPNTYTTTTTTVADNYESDDATEQMINKVLKDIEKNKDNFEVEEYVEGVNLQVILDSSAIEQAFGTKKEDVTYDTIIQDINSNSNIPQKYKDLYITLANNLKKQYPDMDLRIWHENLKTMQIKEVDEMDMKIKAVSASAYATYRKDENVIYTVKDYNYEPGTWEYQVIMHEMCHPIRSGIFKVGKNEVNVHFESRSGEGTIISEAMNSLLAVRSYDQNERDIAYQLQSNMVELMVDSMDNYTYQDYVEHSLTYFENELNKQNGNDKAVEIVGLINLQYKDYHDNKVLVDEEMFHEVYDYIADMYYSKNINSSMSYEEASKVKDTFIDRLTFDVPEEYNISVNHINEHFNDYCNQLGIGNGYQY